MRMSLPRLPERGFLGRQDLEYVTQREKEREREGGREGGREGEREGGGQGEREQSVQCVVCSLLGRGYTIY